MYHAPTAPPPPQPSARRNPEPPCEATTSRGDAERGPAARGAGNDLGSALLVQLYWKSGAKVSRNLAPCLAHRYRMWMGPGSALVLHCTALALDRHQTGTALLLHWLLTRYCMGTALELRWYDTCKQSTGSAPVLGGYDIGPHWYCTGTTLVLHWCCAGTTLALHWYGMGTTLAVSCRWHCAGTTPVLYQY